MEQQTPTSNGMGRYASYVAKGAGEITGNIPVCGRSRKHVHRVRANVHHAAIFRAGSKLR
jgi:hypothetical protein